MRFALNLNHPTLPEIKDFNALDDAKRLKLTAARFKPHVERHAGYRLNALVSTLANASGGKLAAEFINAKKQPNILQVFGNTILAQGWQDAPEENQEAVLAARAEPFGCPRMPKPPCPTFLESV